MVKAMKYSLEASDSVLGYIHGGIYSITEIFIPDKKICFNIGKKQLNVFKVDKPRCNSDVDMTDVLLERGFVGDLEKIISLRKKCLEKGKEIFK